MIIPMIVLAVVWEITLQVHCYEYLKAHRIYNSFFVYFFWLAR